MAMSLSHPDPASPASVADASFGTARRGFDQGQVRDFLRMVAAELGRLQERERFLERELRTAQSNPDLDAASLDDAALTRLLGEETARVLNTARESAREIREKAEESAARMLAEASDEVARIREQADLDAARMRADAASDAESEIEMAKQQGREMVTEARAYRERVLSELARRRELAREQIEQLVHGRDRLIQAFERARLAAVDVVGELEPLGEPSEYVNLTPTTGPVPVMVPNARPDPEPTAALPRTLDPGTDDEPTTAEIEADDGDGASEVAGRASEVATGADDSASSGSEVTASDDRSGADDIEGAPDDEMSADEMSADEMSTDERDDEMSTDQRDGDADDAEGSSSGDTLDGDEVTDEFDADAGRADDDADMADDGADADASSAGDHANIDDEGTADDATVEDSVEADEADDEPDVDVVAGDVDAGADDEHEDLGGHGAGEASGEVEARDDVVVDLFARLRAGATPADDSAGTGEAGEETPNEPEDEHPTVASATVVGDLDDTDAAADVAVDDEEPVDDDSPFRRRDAALTPLIVASARKLKRVLADEQNGVLEVLRRDADVTTLDELVPGRDEQTARYAEAVAGELADAAAAGGWSVAGDDASLDDAAIAAARSAAGEIVADWLVGPLRERLERCVDEGDGDNVAVSRRVRSVYREWKTQHIDEQLDDVLRTAYGRGALGAVDRSTALLWLVDGEHPACPDCDDNSLSPPVTAGDPFPTGHTFAPAHPGCRCLVAVADR